MPSCLPPSSCQKLIADSTREGGDPMRGIGIITGTATGETEIGAQTGGVLTGDKC